MQLLQNVARKKQTKQKKCAAYEYLTLLGNAAQGIIIIISTIIGRLAGWLSLPPPLNCMRCNNFRIVVKERHFLYSYTIHIDGWIKQNYCVCGGEARIVSKTNDTYYMAIWLNGLSALYIRRKISPSIRTVYFVSFFYYIIFLLCSSSLIQGQLDINKRLKDNRTKT